VTTASTTPIQHRRFPPPHYPLSSLQYRAMKHFLPILLLITVAVTSCQEIETGDSLAKKTIDNIKWLGLLDDKEIIIRFYSNYRKDVAGNFFTDKRIAHYWLLGGKDAGKDRDFAFYPDIIAIDTTYDVPDTFVPYMTITKKDSSRFKVYVDGTRKEVKTFFEEAIQLWKKNRSTGNK
jgi:hypothetical protein